MLGFIFSGAVYGSERLQPSPLAFERVAEVNTPLVGRSPGRNLAPVASDLDGDGKPELYVGAHGRRMVVLKHSGNGRDRSVFSEADGASNPLDAVTMSYESDTPCVALADVDGDGDDDAVWFDFRPAGNSFTSLYMNGMVFLKNEGTRGAPDFQMATDEENPFAGILSEWQGTPAFGDFDGDGDVDLIFGDRDGTFRYCRNMRMEEGAVVFAEMMGALNPFTGIDVGDNSSPTVFDIDGDGDLDVVSGDLAGGLRWIENITHPDGRLSFALKDPEDTPFSDFTTGIASMPAAMDIDSDADMDLVVGDSDGHLSLLVNQQHQPAIAYRTDSVSSTHPRSRIKGDLNGDEVADLKDAILALKTLAGALIGALSPGRVEGGAFPWALLHGNVRRLLSDRR